MIPISSLRLSSFLLHSVGATRCLIGCNLRKHPLIFLLYLGRELRVSEFGCLVLPLRDDVLDKLFQLLSFRWVLTLFRHEQESEAGNRLGILGRSRRIYDGGSDIASQLS